MTARTNKMAGSCLALAVMLAGGCSPRQPPVPIAAPPSRPAPVRADSDPAVTATIVGGEAAVPAAPSRKAAGPARGDVQFNFPSASVRVVAQSVLGDTLRVPFTIAPGVDTQVVTFVTPGPVARSAVPGLLENALKTDNLALVAQGGGYVIMPVAAAQASGTTFSAGAGYGTEIIELKFINAEELRKLLDSVVPGVVSAVDSGRNTLTLAGTSGQRTNARDIIRQFDVNWLRSMSFALFMPQRTDARLIVPELEKLINASDAPTRGLVRLIAMEKLNGIIAVSAQRQYLEDVRRWIEILDREGTNNEPRLFVYRVQNGRSRDLVKTLNAAFGNAGAATDDNQGRNDPLASSAPDDRQPRPAAPANPVQSGRPGEAGATDQSTGGARLAVRISSDEVNNAVIVFGTARDYAVVEDALRKLDVPPTQVMIEAAITEVSLTDDLRFGVQWNFQTGDSNFALSEGTGASPVRILPGFSYFFSNQNDISATLNALEQRTNVKVVSAPKLVVLNNQTAALQVGDQVPVSTQSSVSVQNPDSPIVNAVEYRDTGVILKITPRVNAGGLVLLDVAQEVSDVVQTNSSKIDSPTISTRRVSTSVAVQDGQIIALGGLFRDSRSFGKNGLPLLSRIPVLGSLLFGNTNNLQKRTELIILLKPHVLRTAEDSSAITNELRAKIRTLEPFRTQGRMP